MNIRASFTWRLAGLVLLLAAASIFLVSPCARAWDTPDRVMVDYSMPPKFWIETGGIKKEGKYNLQQYKLFGVGNKDLNKFRWAAIWSKGKGKFCVEVLDINTAPSSLPDTCEKTLKDSAVTYRVSGILRQKMQ